MESIFDMFAQDNNPTASSAPADFDTPVLGSVPFTGKTFIVSIGGSVLLDEKPRTSFIAKFTQVISNLSQEGYRFGLVAGGGSLARTYIAAGKSFGANNFVLDELGIQVSRLNAMLLISALENAHPEVIINIPKAKRVLDKGKIPILGGLLPGITTDTVAALLAECAHADFINLTNTDGIYSADPREHAHAKRISHMNYEQLVSLMRVAETKPGQNVVLDMPSCLILKRSNIRSLVLNGMDLENFQNAVRGLDFVGTRIESNSSVPNDEHSEVEFM